MSARRQEEATAKPESPLLAGLPDPPEGWVPLAFKDPAGAWVRGLREVDADGADRSGPDKAFRVVRRLSWAAHLVGGSKHLWCQRLTGTDNDAEIAQLIAAAEAWAGRDNRMLKQQLEAAESAREEMAARMAPYRRARLPYPPEWDRELHAAEKALTDASRAWHEGRARLDQLAAELAKAEAAAYRALGGCLGNVADRLGAEAERIVRDGDTEFWSSFPSRAPGDLRVLHKRACVVNELMAALDHTRPYRGLERFARGAGEIAAGIITAMVSDGRAVLEREPSHPMSERSIMGAVY